VELAIGVYYAAMVAFFSEVCETAVIVLLATGDNYATTVVFFSGVYSAAATTVAFEGVC
jgi:ABC-type uncharacterized transport system permease subunit